MGGNRLSGNGVHKNKHQSIFLKSVYLVSFPAF